MQGTNPTVPLIPPRESDARAVGAPSALTGGTALAEWVRLQEAPAVPRGRSPRGTRASGGLRTSEQRDR